MRAFDGIQHGTLTERPAPRRTVERSQPSRRRGSGQQAVILLLLCGGLFFALFRPTPTTPPVADAPASASSTTNPNSSLKLPPQLTLPQGGGSTASLDELVILDQPTESSAPQPEESTQDQTTNLPATFTIRILNGSGKAGAAAALKDRLSAEGYTISAIGNATGSYSTTTVYYQTDKQLQAEAVAQTLGNPPVTLEQDSIAAPADVLVVIGADR